MAYEDNTYQYEYNVKDHLGNVRQVLRNPTSEGVTATMESGSAPEEEAAFSQLSESRQLGPEHNVTDGGNQVAWLNADRGRIVGPGRTQPIFAGDSVTLRVHGKYADDNLAKINAGSYLTQSAKDRMVDGLSELAGSLQRSGTGNPIAILNLANIIAGDLQNKETPEAYLIYALYDQDSNRYEVGKQVLTKNAANQHEVLEENLYISEDGYLETFVVNETPEDVWFDDFTVMSTTSPIMQETHYDPWGLELTGIGFQYGGIKANKYLFNGKELIEDNGLRYYDYGARMYDPVIGRWGVVDALADEPEQVDRSPYAYAWNNPINLTDPDGNCPRCLKILAKTVVKSVAKGKLDLGDVYDLVDAGATLIDPNSSALDKGLALFDIVSPVSSKELKAGAKMLGLADGANDANKTAKKTYQTYFKDPKDPKDGVYSGKTSGTGTPEDNVRKRDKNHHMDETHGPARLDQTSSNPDAITGREQQNIENSGRAKSKGGTSGNQRNSVDPNNNERVQRTQQAAKKEFGN